MNPKKDLYDRVKTYIGGQMEIQNSIESYMYRGEIESIDIKDKVLIVKFSWLAKGEGYPPIPKTWVKDEKLDYAAGLEIFNVSEIGDNRLCFQSSITNETVVLFPIDGSKLDPSKVVGLEKKLQ